MPKKTRYIVKTLSDKQITTLLNSIKGKQIEVPVLLAMWCGLRRGEIAGLRWEDVDFENNKLYIRQTIVRAEGGQTVKTPKSFSGTREVPLPQYVANKIKELKRENNSSNLVMGKAGQTIYQNFKAFLKEHPQIPDIRFHDLRHMCATIMLSLGISDLITSDKLGHADPHMTKKYQHIRMEEQSRSQSLLDGFFESKINV